ncbi:MAG: hypothetical protein AAGA97_09460 [Pseudomonadota bacterium]
MKRLFLSLALAVITPGIGQAQTFCAPRDALIEVLETRYGETVVAIAMSAGQGVLEIWANHETGTWTATLTRADHVMCAVGYGDSFQFIAPGEDL